MFNIVLNVNLYDIQIFIIANKENLYFIIRQISHGKIRDLISFYLDENLKTQVIDFWTSTFKFYDLCDRNLFYDKQPAKE